MAHNITTRRPWWFWVLMAVYLIWSLIGVGMYLAEHLMSDTAYAEMFGDEMLALRGQVPWWAVSGYAVGVWGGLAGVIMLMMRKRVAIPLFVASFIGAVIGFIPSMTDDRFKAQMGTADYGFMIFIFAECLFILWLARLMLRPAKIPNMGESFD